MALQVKKNVSPDGISVARDLIHWFKTKGRRLPWRQPRTLYGTIVSEFMLQQTRVEAVIPYFSRWMERLPTPESAALASQREILLLWSGLGYYGRARNLHHLCAQLVEGESPPRTPREWQVFSGIGPYTAAAIASLGQGFDVVPLDGNGIRVLSRLWGRVGSFKSRREAEGQLRPLADGLAIPGKCGTIGEALMDLGASICGVSSTCCGECPLEKHCLTRGRPGPSGDTFPNRARALPTKIHRLWACDGQILWLQWSPLGRLGEMAELPVLDSDFSLPVLFTGKRSIGQVRYGEIIHDGRTMAGEIFRNFCRKSGKIFSIALADRETIPLSGPHHRWIEKLLRESQKAG
jgi:A/G-specific adenine glycosylase